MFAVCLNFFFIWCIQHSRHTDKYTTRCRNTAIARNHCRYARPTQHYAKRENLKCKFENSSSFFYAQSECINILIPL